MFDISFDKEIGGLKVKSKIFLKIKKVLLIKCINNMFKSY